MKKTKIICTIGPSSKEIRILEKMIRGGMNVARFNFSHGSYDQMDELINNLHAAELNCARTIALMQDLQGPKIRVGKINSAGVLTKKGQKILLLCGKKVNSKINGKVPQIPVQYAELAREVKKDQKILIEDGLIELKVLSTDKKKRILCTVIVGGTIKTHKGINLPDANLSAAALSTKDKKDILFGLKYNFDYIALSFVKSAEDIQVLRRFLKKHHCDSKIIAKIERPEALKNLQKIIEAADAVMVARGDLGVEIDLEKVPVVQKEIVRLANIQGKPSIIATQMLNSMIENFRATRAEISDAATAIFDHADAFMLSNETSVGKYPILATKTLSRVATITENEIAQSHLLLNDIFAHHRDVPFIDATCLNACEIAREVQARALIIITDRLEILSEITRHRPYTCLITVSDNQKLLRLAQLVWGINRMLYQKNLQNTRQILSLLKKYKWLKSADEVVIFQIKNQSHTIQTLKVF